MVKVKEKKQKSGNKNKQPTEQPLGNTYYAHTYIEEIKKNTGIEDPYTLMVGKDRTKLL